MSMELVQVRLPQGLLNNVDNLVKQKIYVTRSDVIRDAIRILTVRKQIGSVPNTGDSVKEIKEIRKRLSKEKFDLDEINRR